MFEYLKAFIFANKTRNKKQMGFFNDEKAINEIEKLVESMEKLASTGFVERAENGNFVLAELANAQVEVRELKKEIALARQLLTNSKAFVSTMVLHEWETQKQKFIERNANVEIQN